MGSSFREIDGSGKIKKCLNLDHNDHSDPHCHKLHSKELSSKAVFRHIILHRTRVSSKELLSKTSSQRFVCRDFQQTDHPPIDKVMNQRIGFGFYRSLIPAIVSRPIY